MALIVQKFGGSSVGNIDKIQQVANKIIETRAQGHQLVVVVSAMEGETNRLISLAKILNDQPDAREYDLLLATGEQAATALLAMALLAQGCPARSYNSFHVPIYTDNHHKKARILSIEEEVLRCDIGAGRVPIVAGFQGISEQGDMTTLGRGGSDTTAAALAAVLKADECQIYTDVDGIYTADPHLVPQAQRLDKIGFIEMTEFARAGAKVVQHRAVELASKYRIPLRVLSSFQRGSGTLIQASEEESGVEGARIAGITASHHESKLTIHGLTTEKKAMSQFFSLLNDARIEIDMLTQQQISQKQMDITFTLARVDYPQAEQLLQTLVREKYAKTIMGDNKLAKLSVVGIGLHSHPGIIHTLFQTLDLAEINVILALSSALRISLMVSESQIVRGVQVLHRAFGLGKE
ncbi:MAG: aspartate kinase [Candidatus Aquirickettsiella gammari]|uniref:Aspartokinase n=1 Tax=Candidatus Aquirickettsiella gammari TaxID=2016198 RepID=A0A370CMV0_9COXI|nr:MAG: aspartate kinase [Candidatus Aquirickettsiella gammari]